MSLLKDIFYLEYETSEGNTGIGEAKLAPRAQKGTLVPRGRQARLVREDHKEKPGSLEKKELKGKEESEGRLGLLPSPL